MKLVGSLVVLALILCANSGLVQAHHSATMFDFEKELTLTGTVKEFQYTNPHAWLIITVTDDSGKATDWSVEFGAPTLLRARGIGKRSFAPGEEVTVTLHPMKDGRPAGENISTTKTDDPQAY